VVYALRLCVGEVGVVSVPVLWWNPEVVRVGSWAYLPSRFIPDVDDFVPHTVWVGTQKFRIGLCRFSR
jgi:hypothetical protein